MRLLLISSVINRINDHQKIIFDFQNHFFPDQKKNSGREEEIKSLIFQNHFFYD
jgi:hypothetical protein